MTFLTLARVVFAALFVAITYLTVTPNPADVEGGMDFARWIASMFLGDASYGDKVAHFFAYGALGAAAAVADIRIAGRTLLTVIAFALYGASLEGVQALGAVRSPELLDALANSLGALISYPLALRLVEAARGRARARA